MWAEFRSFRPTASSSAEQCIRAIERIEFSLNLTRMPKILITRVCANGDEKRFFPQRTTAQTIQNMSANVTI